MTDAEFLPPEHEVRVSPRARRVRLRVTLNEGLVVTVPRGFPRSRVPDVLRKEADWIARATARLEGARLEASRLPQQVELRATGERFEVRAREVIGLLPRVKEKPGILELEGEVSDLPACREALRGWLKRKARKVLVPRLAGLAAAAGLEHGAVSIRLQRTRWGSCSKKGGISLNAALLMLQADLVDHVLLHELCHTVRFDHSERFWALLEQHSPGARQASRDLRRAWRELPAWLETH